MVMSPGSKHAFSSINIDCLIIPMLNKQHIFSIHIKHSYCSLILCYISIRVTNANASFKKLFACFLCCWLHVDIKVDKAYLVVTSISLSVYLSACLPACLPVCLSVCLSVCNTLRRHPVLHSQIRFITLHTKD